MVAALIVLASLFPAPGIDAGEIREQSGSWQPEPVVVHADGWAYDETQMRIFEFFEPRGLGHFMVRVSYFEGYFGSTLPGCYWSTTCISPTGDACPLQINQVHDDNEYGAIRVLFGDDARWPGPVLDMDGCLAVADYLLDVQGLGAWVNSSGGHSSGRPINSSHGLPVAPSSPINEPRFPL